MSNPEKEFKKALTFSPLKEGVDKMTPDMPGMEKPKTAPVSDDMEARKARRRAASRRAGSGRASTVLTNGASSLG